MQQFKFTATKYCQLNQINIYSGQVSIQSANQSECISNMIILRMTEKSPKCQKLLNCISDEPGELNAIWNAC